MNKPQTLYDIYQEVIKDHLGASSFRVRDVDTCLDYLICNIFRWKWDYKNYPKEFCSLLLEPPFTGYYTMHCDEEIYILLSSRDEIQSIREVVRKYGEDHFIELIKNHYNFISVCY